MTASRRTKGFTIIEILVVILIIALVTSVAVPAYGRFHERALFQSFTMDVQDAFAYAREQAIARDTTCKVVFDTQAHQITTVVTPETQHASPQQNQPGLQGAPDPDSQRDPVPPPRILHMPEFVVVQAAGKSSVQYNPDGTCEGAAVAIQAGAYHAQLVVLPGNGRATLVEDQAP